MFAEALIVTEAVYDVRESDIFPRTFETDYIRKTFIISAILVILGDSSMMKIMVPKTTLSVYTLVYM